MSPSPCNECLCVPICRWKSFDVTMADCLTIQIYLYESSQILRVKRPDFETKIVDMVVDLQPGYWEVVIDNYKGSLQVVYTDEYVEKLVDEVMELDREEKAHENTMP
ncbi:MAG: hypothetical protein ACTSW1_07730 [Candidatus Hodarchaeales archaeon]